MRLYVELIKNAFHANIAYRMEVFVYLFGQVINLFIQVYIWKTLYGGSSRLATGVGNVTLEEMITYVVISTCVSVFATSDVLFRIFRKVVNGEIAMDLIKPISLMSNMFCQSFGMNVFRFFFELIPVFVVSVLFFGLNPPVWGDFHWFLFTLVNALIINYFITYIIGLFSFWYTWVWQFNQILMGMIRLFSGAFIPLWFFPETFLKISLLLPFRLIYYAPISIYLGKAGMAEIRAVIFQQFLWMAVLIAIERLLWSRAVKKLVVHGG